jgi:chemotaxis protein methyltransferase CheR
MGEKAMSASSQAAFHQGAGATPPSREFEFTAADFERVRKLIHEHAGIALAAPSRTWCTAAWRGACAPSATRPSPSTWRGWSAATAGMGNLRQRADHQPHLLLPRGPPLRDLAQHLAKRAEAATVTHLVQRRLDRRGALLDRHDGGGRLQQLTPPVSILASDLDTSVLAQGEAGVYPQERVDKLPRETVARFFLKGANAQAGMVRVRPELQRLIEFKRINLLEAELAGAGAARRHLLPQRDDLLRQAHAVPDPAALPAAAIKCHPTRQRRLS